MTFWLFFCPPTQSHSRPLSQCLTHCRAHNCAIYMEMRWKCNAMYIYIFIGSFFICCGVILFKYKMPNPRKRIRNDPC